jgi:hypothetical protein
MMPVQCISALIPSKDVMVRYTPIWSWFTASDGFVAGSLLAPMAKHRASLMFSLTPFKVSRLFNFDFSFSFEHFGSLSLQIFVVA